MRDPRLTQQPVERDAGNGGQRQTQGGRRIGRQDRGRKKERHEKIAGGAVRNRLFYNVGIIHPRAIKQLIA
jgi:hypothetical protein